MWPPHVGGDRGRSLAGVGVQRLPVVAAVPALLPSTLTVPPNKLMAALKRVLTFVVVLSNTSDDPVPKMETGECWPRCRCWPRSPSRRGSSWFG